MQEFFKTRTLNYNIRNFRAIQTYRKNTIAFGIETVTYKSSHHNYGKYFQLKIY